MPKKEKHQQFRVKQLKQKESQALDWKWAKKSIYVSKKCFQDIVSISVITAQM